MLEWVATKTEEVTSLFQAVSVLGAIIMVAVAYYKTRTIVALIVAAITAGVFLWTVNNAEWWQERVEEETEVAPLVGEPVADELR
jgi:hypothetical protein